MIELPRQEPCEICETLAGRSNAAVAGDRPEVEQVREVERLQIFEHVRLRSVEPIGLLNVSPRGQFRFFHFLNLHKKLIGL